MVGVDMRLQNPFDAQPLSLNRFGDGIGGVRPYPSGGGIIVEHWIDDRGGLRRRIYNKVAKGFGHLFEEWDNPRTHGLLRFDSVEGHLLLLDQISIHVTKGMPANGMNVGVSRSRGSQTARKFSRASRPIPAID